jgi:hemerythrin superfamily protein
MEVSDVTDLQQKDVVGLLLEQHNEIKSLFSQLATAQGTQKRELFQDLVRLLAVHESAEETVVHPAARRAIENGEQVVESRLHEEDEAKHALAELYDLGVDHPDFDPKLAKLRDAVIAHATREENDEFLYLRQKLPADRLRRMAGALQAAEKAAPTRPHPATGESAPANLLAGPPVAVFDRIRDKLRDWREKDRDD